MLLKPLEVKGWAWERHLLLMDPKVHSIEQIRVRVFVDKSLSTRQQKIKSTNKNFVDKNQNFVDKNVFLSMKIEPRSDPLSYELLFKF